MKSVIRGAAATLALCGANTAAAEQPLPAAGFWAGAQYMHVFRGGLNGRDASFLDTNARVPVLRTDDVNPKAKNGYKVFAGFTWDGVSGLDGSFMQFRTFRRARSVTSPTEDLQPFLTAGNFTNADIDDYTDAFAHTLDYRSTFLTAELNYRRDMGRYWGVHTVVIVGFRYANLRERLVFATLDEAVDPQPSTYEIRTRNRMFGGQVGVRLHRPLEILRGLGVGLDATAALMANRTRQHTVFLNDTNPQDVTNITVARTRLATMFEGTFRVTYEPMHNLSIFAGYTVIAINGVALAPKQFGTPANLKSNGTVIYHGPLVGLKFRIGG